MKIRLEKVVDYMNFPDDLQEYLRNNYIDCSSSNGSYTTIVIEEGESDPVIEFLKKHGAIERDEILLLISW